MPSVEQNMNKVAEIEAREQGQAPWVLHMRAERCGSAAVRRACVARWDAKCMYNEAIAMRATVQ